MGNHFGTAPAGLALVAVVAALAVTATPAGADQPPARLMLGLDDAVAMALGSDEQLRQAAEAVRGAEADLLGAGSGRLPQLSVAGSWTSNLKKPSFFLPPDMAAGFGGETRIEMGRDVSVQGAATLSWRLWSAGRLSAGVGAAREALNATRWQRALVADVVAYQARATYFGTLLAAEQVRIAEKAMAETEEALRVARAGHEQGTTSRFDLLRAEVEVANRTSPLIQARNAQDQALLALRRLCGLPASVDVVLADSLAAVSAPESLESLLDRMSAGSPELKALDRMVALRRQSVSLARAGRGPVVQLQGQYVLQGETDDLFPGDDERATSATAALAVSMPIFDGFAAKADIGRAEADLRAAEAELDRVGNDRRLSVRQARLALESARAALDGRRESVALAEEAHRLALVRLENGIATPLERLDAELALTEARAQLAQTLYDCNVARAALDLAVGGTNGNVAPAAQEESE